MPKNLLDAGEVIKHKGNEFEVVHVMVQTDENDKPTNYIYELITKKEADANRKRNEEAQRAAAQAEILDQAA